MRTLGLLAVVLLLVVVMGGCAKPPEAEQKAAKSAMDAAMSAGADKKIYTTQDIWKLVSPKVMQIMRMER